MNDLLTPEKPNKMTYRDMLVFLNSLPKNMLDLEVLVWAGPETVVPGFIDTFGAIGNLADYLNVSEFSSVPLIVSLDKINSVI